MVNDSKEAYGDISMVAHWIAAVFIVAIWVVGMVFEVLPRGGTRVAVMNIHVSIGLIALPFLLWRVYWRIKSGFPVPLPGPDWQALAAKVVHVLLLADIVAVVITGPVAVWSAGRPLEFFEWFAIPSPIGKVTALHEAMETMHVIAANPVLWLLMSLHLLGVLKHLFLDRGSSMERIASFGRSA